MNNRRKLKKVINKTMEYLYIGCFLYKDTPNADIESVNSLIKEINIKHSDLISRISVKEGREVKGRTKLFYKKLMSDFIESINTFDQKIESLS